MRKLLFVFALLSISLTGISGNENDMPFILKGKVIEQETNEPLTGVAVLINETGDVVYTDFDGNFTYTTPKNGAYHLTFSYVSYDDNTMEFSSETNNMTISLK